MSSNDFARDKNETRCFTGLNLHFGAKTGNLNWGNSENNFTGLTWKRNSFPPSYVEIVSIVCFGTNNYFSRIEFVRFCAHYRKKKRVFLWVLQSINNIFNCNCGSSPTPHPPPSAPSSEFSGSFRPCSMIMFSERLAFIVAISGFIIFQRSKRPSRNFPLCKPSCKPQSLWIYSQRARLFHVQYSSYNRDRFEILYFRTA